MTNLSNDEDISQPGGEHVTIAVLDVDDVEGALMSLSEKDKSKIKTGKVEYQDFKMLLRFLCRLVSCIS